MARSHAWNLVGCSGNYYYVDTTGGDPVFQAAEGEEVNQQQMITMTTCAAMMRNCSRPIRRIRM